MGKFDKRIDKLEEKITAAGELPKEAKGPYVAWDDSEEPFAEIKANLLERFGTYEGAQFFTLGWNIKSDTDKAQTESV